MATYDLEEQEQISELKSWWSQYGNLVTTVVTLAALGTVAWQVWNWHQRNQSAQASVLFAIVEKAASERDPKRARDAAGELVEKYAGTAYAGLGALISAHAQFEAGDLKSARAQLAWAADNARDVELRDVARLRLAAVLLDEKSFDEALKQLEKPPAAPFAARAHELRGDILVSQGKDAEARAAYQAALAQMDDAKDMPMRENPMLRQIVQSKLESLGGTQ